MGNVSFGSLRVLFRVFLPKLNPFSEAKHQKQGLAGDGLHLLSRPSRLHRLQQSESPHSNRLGQGQGQGQGLITKVFLPSGQFKTKTQTTDIETQRENIV